MRRAKIAAIQYELPDRIETNEQLAVENPDWRMDEIYAKTGISARRIAAPEETAGDLACKAAQRLFEGKAVGPSEVDFILFCTQSPDYFLPATACCLQSRLGIPKSAGALDFNQGCSGFVYGLCLAKSLIESGTCKNVLLLTAETYTKFINPRDRLNRPLFGDGGAATLVSESCSGIGFVGDFVFGTDGNGARNLIVPGGGARNPPTASMFDQLTEQDGCPRRPNQLFMDGGAVFAFAINTVPKSIDALLRKTGLQMGDIDHFIFHQASRFMLEHLLKKLKVPAEKAPFFMEEVGNTVSATIPIVLQAHSAQGRFKRGQKIMLIGFGVGYSWAAGLMEWDDLR
jgi:3-oxoacyl-[acyl-carrier-protein] synthase-3